MAGFLRRAARKGLRAYAALNEDLAASGELIVLEALAGPSLAKRVSVREGRTMTSSVDSPIVCWLDETERRGSMTSPEKIMTGERADLLQTLAKHRGFLRFTVRDLTDEQAAQRTTVSELCLGGLIKHVATTEERWMRFAVGGAEAMEAEPVDWQGQFRMLEGETLAGLLDTYDQVARKTDELVSTLPDLDVSYPLPKAPWFEPGARWSRRRVLLHIIAETSQHAGHADIIRESLDGAKTMGSDARSPNPQALNVSTATEC